MVASVCSTDPGTQLRLLSFDERQWTRLSRLTAEARVAHGTFTFTSSRGRSRARLLLRMRVEPVGGAGSREQRQDKKKQHLHGAVGEVSVWSGSVRSWRHWDTNEDPVWEWKPVRHTE